MANSELGKDRERVINRFIDDIFDYCGKYDIKFVDETLFLLSFMIMSTLETIEDMEGKK